MKDYSTRVMFSTAPQLEMSLLDMCMKIFIGSAHNAYILFPGACYFHNSKELY